MPAPNTDNIGRRENCPIQVRYFSILIRSFHQLAVTFFIGTSLWGPPSSSRIFLLVAVITGLILLFLEGLRHRQFYRETFGLITFAKILALGLVYHRWLPATPALILIFISAAIIAHAPKWIRHRLLI